MGSGRRNRIVEIREVRAGDLIADDRNWRRHPEAQRRALRQQIDALGFADPVIARRDGDRLVIVDGHARAALDPEARVPVCVVDLSAAEAGEAMATLDPISMLAEGDGAALAALLDEARADVRTMFESDDRLAYYLGASRTRFAGDVPAPGSAWALGDHRLLCGRPGAVPDVIAGWLAEDPPALIHTEIGGAYGIGWASDLEEVAALAPRKESGAWYVWHPRDAAVGAVEALRAAGVHVAQEIVLLASGRVYGAEGTGYRPEYRVGQFGWRGNRPKSRPYGVRRGGAETTVWTEEERWRGPLLRHAERDRAVLDPFAVEAHVLEAERLGRRVIGAASSDVIGILAAAPVFEGRVRTL